MAAIADSQNDDDVRRTIHCIESHQRSKLQELATILIQQDAKFQSLEDGSRRILCSLLKTHTSTTSHIDKRFDELHSRLDATDQNILYSLRSFRAAFFHDDSRKRFLRVALCFLDSLRFDQIDMRHSAIPREHAQTCAWVLNDGPTVRKWSSFTRWLTTDAGIYWVSGKAGSGKSTLMKFIWNHPQTTQLLTEWAQGERVLCAGFFFWNSGEKIQSSQEGLFRTLLYQLCRQDPELLHRTFPDEWKTISGKVSRDTNPGQVAQKSLAELKDAFEKIVACSHHNLRMCVFVDGLDEAEGDLMDITDFMVGVAKSNPHFKMCVSSRPWPIFETSFEDEPSLRMQDLNGDDIRRFTVDKLGRDSKVRSLLRPEPGKAEWLIEEVVSRASGVFLWVYLVVNLLIKGIRDGDDTTSLYNRLLSLPRDLEPLFDRIIGQIEPEHREEASQIFQIFRANGNHLDILTMHRALKYARPDALQAALRLKVTSTSVIKRAENYNLLEALVKRGIRRLNSRCRGLLEVEEVEETAPKRHIPMEDLTEVLARVEVAPERMLSREGNSSVLSSEQMDDSDLANDEYAYPASLDYLPSFDVYGRDTDLAQSEEGPFLRRGFHRPSAEPSPPQLHDPLQVRFRYLHRTARDYLEQPRVWSRILAMCDPFDPNAALIAACVNTVKSSDKHVQPGVMPAITPISYAYHLRHMGLRPSTTYLNLIDELDRSLAARQMESDINQLASEAYNEFVNSWECLRPTTDFVSAGSSNWGGHELDIALQPALPWYPSLKDEAETNGTLVCLEDSHGLPLTFSALLKRTGIPPFVAMTLSWLKWTAWLSPISAASTFAAPTTGAAALLRSIVSTPGFGPDNYNFRGHTLWEYIITLTHNLSNIYDSYEVFELWLSIFEIMLENEANPCASCIHDSDKFTDAISFSREWAVPEVVASHMTVPADGLATAGNPELQRSSRRAAKYHHSVEGSVRDVFVRRGLPGAERLLSSVHSKMRMWEDLNVRRHEDADEDDEGVQVPHWVS